MAGSTERWGMAAWPPLPVILTQKRSAAAMMVPSCAAAAPIVTSEIALSLQLTETASLVWTQSAAALPSCCVGFAVC